MHLISTTGCFFYRAPIVSLLPHVRDEAIPHRARIFSVAWQISTQESFFIESAPHQNRHKRWDKKECPPRAKCKRHSDKKEERTGIHRMPDVRIGAGRDDCLILDHLDRGCGETVYLDHPKHEKK